MSQYVFGTGQLFALPVGGGAPLRFGALQDVSVDFNGDIKRLHGQYQYALDTARGKTNIDWKAASGNIDVEAFNQLFFGEEVDAGNELTQVINEAGSVPAMSTYTITAAHGADFVMDLGVYYAATGLPLTQVASGSEAVGKYSVSAAGVYTFAAADASAAVLLNYLWENSAAGGSLELSNQLMGTTPKFQLVLSQTYDSKVFTLLLYSCVSEKLSLPLKQDDYLIAEMNGSAMADAANRVARITTTSITGGGA
jgi:hypothetical protein